VVVAHARQVTEVVLVQVALVVLAPAAVAAVAARPIRLR